MVNFTLFTSARYSRGRKLTIYVKPRLSELFRYPNNVWSRRVRINGVLLYLFFSNCLLAIQMGNSNDE